MRNCKTKLFVREEKQMHTQHTERLICDAETRICDELKRSTSI